MRIACFWAGSQPATQDRRDSWRVWLPPAAGIVVLWLSLAVLFFFVFKYQQPPWYYTSDQDAILGPQIILLLNDGDYTHLHHPEATTIAAQAAVHRVMALLGDADAQSVLHLLESGSLQDVSRLLSHVARVGRVMALLSTMVLIGASYFMILQLSRSWPVAFVFTAVLAGSNAILNRVNFAAIRAETQSVAILLVAALVCQITLSRKGRSFLGVTLGLLLAGICLGLAFWAKLQILPQMAMFLLAVSAWIAFGQTNVKQATSDRNATTINLALAILSLLVCPWWALVRPGFLTPEFVSRITYGPDRRLYDGDLPASYVAPIAAVLLFMVAVTLIVVLARGRMSPSWWTRLAGVSLLGNASILGGIVSSYLVVFPFSVSWQGYFTNLHHLVYVTLKNVSQGSLANAFHESSFPLEKWQPVDALLNIWRLHGSSVSRGTMCLLFFVGVVGVLCLLRVVLAPSKGGVSYLIPIWLFATGLVADIASSTRNTYYVMSYYAVYSVPFYLLGLAIFTHLELRGLDPGLRLRQAWKVTPRIVALLFVGLIVAQYCYGATTDKVKYKRPEGNDLKRGNSLVRTVVPHFAAAVQYALDRASDAAGVEKLAEDSHAQRWSLQQGSHPGHVDMQLAPPAYRVTLERTEEQIPWVLSQKDTSDPGPYGVERATASLWLDVAAGYAEDEIVLFGNRDLSLGISVAPAGYSFLKPYVYFGGLGSPIDPDRRMQRGEWHQIVVVKEPEMLRLYLDGVEAGSRHIEAASVISGPFGMFVSNSETGSDSQVLSTSQVTTWGTALTEEEVERLFKVQRNTYVDTAFSDLRGILEEQGLSRR